MTLLSVDRNSAFALKKERLYFLLKFIGEKDSSDDFADSPLSVDYHCHGEHISLIKPSLRFLAAHHDRVIDLDALCEFLHLGQLFWRISEADDLKAPALIFPLSLDEIGHFGPAGGAPRGPKVYEDHFLFVIAQPKSLPLSIFEL